MTLPEGDELDNLVYTHCKAYGFDEIKFREWALRRAVSNSNGFVREMRAQEPKRIGRPPLSEDQKKPVGRPRKVEMCVCGCGQDLRLLHSRGWLFEDPRFAISMTCERDPHKWSDNAPLKGAACEIWNARQRARVTQPMPPSSIKPFTG